MEQRENNQLVAGLDACQQCVTLEGQVQASRAAARSARDLCHILLQQYLDLARRTSELCLDAQGLMKHEDLVLGKELADSTHTSGGRRSKGQRIDETSSAGEIQARGESRNDSRKRHGSCAPQAQTLLSSITGSTPDLRRSGNKMSKTATLRGVGSPE